MIIVIQFYSMIDRWFWVCSVLWIGSAERDVEMVILIVVNLWKYFFFFQVMIIKFKSRRGRKDKRNGIRKVVSTSNLVPLPIGFTQRP